MKFHHHLFLLPALVAGLNLMPTDRVTAQTFKILHRFDGKEGRNPMASLILSGNTLYGTTGGGGAENGTVFAINSDGTGFTSLHSFTASSTNSSGAYTNSEGADLEAGLILSGSTLYGTAASGGSLGFGTVFAVSTNGTAFTILHAFAGYPGDGANPRATLVLTNNTLYGTTDGGGSSDLGTVFAINTSGTGFTILHTFTGGAYNSNGYYTNSDGAYPDAGLLLSGNTLYGTVVAGGSSGFGIVFAVKTDGTGFTNLHSFTATSGSGGEYGTNNDGAYPESGLILSGNILYGTASEGGSSGNGTVFKINTDGTGFSTLRSFTGADGALPRAGLILSGSTLYGTTVEGGSSGLGTVFTINTDGTGFTNLYSLSGGNDGIYPYGGLLLSGNTLYGTASDYFNDPRNGTVFSLSFATQRTIRYVNVNSANPVPPYTNWTTAARTLQDGVDAAVAGDQILVTNGVYQIGQRTVSGETNRVAVTKPVTLQSVNGPTVTLIQGGPETRCVYLTNSAALMGFTLIGGASFNGGGVWCESASAVVSNCTVTANSARQGGGAHGGTLFNCTLSGNSSSGGGAPVGGGAYGCILNDCTLTRNSAAWLGGGAAESALNNCTLSGNSASDGGGAFDSTLNNCLLTSNSAASEGGGAIVSMLNNCTLTSNSANEGGGAYNSTLNNCIVYYNSAPNGENFYYCRLSYSCTTPLPFDGVGNISAEPQLADLSHLSAGSPCHSAGSVAYATGLDIDGEPWDNPPSIGCDESYPGVVTGSLSVSIQAAYTNVVAGLAVNFTAVIDGHSTANQWEFGDGMVVSNRAYASHSWAAAGSHSVVFRAYNDANQDGISATVTVHVVEQPVHYVALGSANPVAPYSSWATAANNIQDVVDAASVAGALVLVTNGIYRTGERVAGEVGAVPNRVAVTKALIVRSVNGAAVTVIQGYRDPQSAYGEGGVRCVYLANNAALAGFTLSNGAASYGGGVWCESASVIVSNCILTDNLAYLGGGASGGTLNNSRLSGNSSTYGGGASGCMLNNCTFTANSASSEGGGASSCTLNNCRLSGNTSTFGGGASGATLINCTFSGNLATNSGGGASGCRLNNCIVYNNSAPNGDNYSDESFLSYSCTTPVPTNGIGNFTNAPLFVDEADGNLRLQSNSPCINAGSNTFAPAGPDLDGNARIAGGTVDMGAYEFQAPQSHISYAWLQQYGLPTDGSADDIDADGDGLNNWQEWRAGTNPTEALSVLRLLSPTLGTAGLIVTWQSVVGRNYLLERCTHLAAQPLFLPLATGIVGQPGTTTFIDTNAIGAGPFFYRIEVKEELP